MSAIFLILYGLVLRLKTIKPFYRYLRSFLVSLSIVSAGLLTSSIRDTSHDNQYVRQFWNDISRSKIRIYSPVEEHDSVHKFIGEYQTAELSNGEWYPAHGFIKVTVIKKSFHLEYGDHLILLHHPSPFKEPLNPGTFDYKKYEERKGIFVHQFVHGNEVLKLPQSSPNPFYKLAYNIRMLASQSIDRHISDHEANEVAHALLLGEKSKVESDLKAAYSHTGAMHVLAVSGLHVGIIYLIISALFRIGNLRYRAKYLELVVILAAIIFYAFVTGLSPSVIRSAVMFSVLAIGKLYSKPTNTYNALGISAFFMLLFDPNSLFDLGFQLSFTAVLGILFFQPKIYAGVKSKNKIVKYVWGMTSVSLAAQLSTLPITLLYFHQYPVYAIFINLFIIPLTFIIMIVGVIYFVFVSLNMLTDTLGDVLEFLIHLLNEIIHITDHLPGAVIGHIYISLLDFILIPGLIVFATAYFIRKRIKYLIISTAICLALLISSIVNYSQTSGQNDLVIFSIRGKSVYEKIHGHTSIILKSDKAQLSDYTLKMIDQFNIPLHIQNTSRKQLESGVQIINKSPSIVRITDDKHLNHVNADYIIVSDNSVDKNTDFSQIDKNTKFVFDSSNNLWKLEHLKHMLMEKGISFHIVDVDGAKIIDLKKP